MAVRILTALLALALVGAAAATADRPREGAPGRGASERGQAAEERGRKAGPDRPAEPERPNIVVIMTDDQTAESLAVMPLTRGMIGSEGVTFTRSFANFPLCCPSRATLLTGQYAHNHGVLANGSPGGGYGQLRTPNVLPNWLRRVGYRTMYVGKYLNGYGSDGSSEVPRGWDDWHVTAGPSSYRYYDYALNENGARTTYGSGYEPQFYSTDFFTERARELIGRAAPARRPFYLNVSYLAPHSGGPGEPDDPLDLATPAVALRHSNVFAAAPLPTPPSLNEADVSDKPTLIDERPPLTPEQLTSIQESYQQRLESLLAVDEGVASIVETLRAAGELDNTLVVFTSDNGFLHGEHRVAAGKTLLYEPSIALPLLMRGPGVRPGTVRRQLVTNADLAPTILDAADARPGRVLDGRSLLGLVEDPTVQWGRELLLEGARSNFGVLEFTGLRNYRYSYIEHASGERELYDLASDPYQLQSVHADPAYQQTMRRLGRRLEALRRCRGRRCRARPRLQLQVFGFGPDRCRLSARIGGFDSRHVRRVRFFVGRGRPRATVSSAPLRARLSRPGRRARVRALVRLAEGRSVTLDRTVRACRR